jgi:predicted DNA binding protein
MMNISIAEVKARDVGWRCRLTKELPDTDIRVRYIEKIAYGNKQYYIVLERICGLSLSSLNRWIKDNAYTVQETMYMGSRQPYCHDLITIDTQKYIVPDLRYVGCYAVPPIRIRVGIARWVIICIENDNSYIKIFRKYYDEKITYVKSEVIRGRKAIDLDTKYVGEDLTVRQLELVRTAYNAGYYEYPRRASLDTLAKKIGIKPSSLSKVLRTSEKKIIGRFLFGNEDECI